MGNMLKSDCGQPIDGFPNCERVPRFVLAAGEVLREGTQSPLVAGAALEKARSERQSLEQADDRADDRALDKVVRILPGLAETYRGQTQSVLDGTSDFRTMHNS